MPELFRFAATPAITEIMRAAFKGDERAAARLPLPLPVSVRRGARVAAQFPNPDDLIAARKGDLEAYVSPASRRPNPGCPGSNRHAKDQAPSSPRHQSRGVHASLKRATETSRTLGSAHRSGRSRSQGGDRDIGVIVAAGAGRRAGAILCCCFYRGDDVGQLDILFCDLAARNSQAVRLAGRGEHDADFFSSNGISLQLLC